MKLNRNVCIHIERKTIDLLLHAATTPESSFSRTISLPERVDGKSVTAQLADGILVVTIPKTGPEEADRVKVNIT